LSITTDTEELVGEAAEMVDMPVDSKIRYFLLLRRPYKLGDTLAPTQAMTQSECLCAKPTVDTNDSLDCTNEDYEVILFLFPEFFAFVSDLELE
jgi:hypothetical protein